MLFKRKTVEPKEARGGGRGRGRGRSGRKTSLNCRDQKESQTANRKAPDHIQPNLE